MVDILHRASRRSMLQVEAESLAGANLAGEYLIHADFHGLNLTGILLPFANLSGADLSRANLTRANLRGANLTEVDLSGADLSGAILSGATLSLTVLHDCINLHKAVGLDSIHHRGPSEIDSKTLAASAARLPYIFLRGAGFTRSEIVDMQRQFPDRIG
jgi:uncharacterized protein YjbI with pentapeptide repeats